MRRVAYCSIHSRKGRQGKRNIMKIQTLLTALAAAGFQSVTMNGETEVDLNIIDNIYASVEVIDGAYDVCVMAATYSWAYGPDTAWEVESSHATVEEVVESLEKHRKDQEALYAQELAYDKAYEAYLETANASE